MSARNAGFAVLQAAYGDRFAAARAFQAAGGKVVGVIGRTAPVEMILAAGGFPLLIMGEDRHPTPLGDRYMPASYDWDFHSIYERALEGAFDFMDLLVVTRAYERMYYFLKEPFRRGEIPGLPPLHVFDLIPTRRPSFRDYNAGQIEAFEVRLKRLAGAPLAEETLAEAIARTNARRGRLKDLARRRRPGGIAGAQAVQASGGALFMTVDAAAAALGTYVEGLPNAGDGRPRILVLPTQQLHHLALHEVLEEAGGVVTAEDDVLGARAGEGEADPSQPPREALLDACFLRMPGANVAPRAEREAWFRTTVTEGDFEAVVFHAPPNDVNFGWDYPGLKAAADAAGLPSLLLREDVLATDGRARALEAASAFLRRGA